MTKVFGCHGSMKCPDQFHSYIDENAVLVAYEIMPSLIGHNDISSVAGTVSKYQQMIGQGYEDSQEKTVKYMVYLLKTLDYSCLLGTSMSLKIFYCHFTSSLLTKMACLMTLFPSLFEPCCTEMN
ncbi:hypothetical protein SAY87_008061 [Trapa incisa]|uniref:Uncharacterized protein n=1 Tax=Trapa incisa TaxID=236973 RepID=A0AAN7KFF2_9MYRT|nr:hypothetical protein SAY87_008061 [Trapa incisa]